MRALQESVHGDRVRLVEQDAAAPDLGVERFDAQEVGVELHAPIPVGFRGFRGERNVACLPGSAVMRRVPDA